MSVNMLNPDVKDAELSQLIASNPCAKCRAVKLAVCQCRIMMGCAAEEETEIEMTKQAVQQQAEERLQEEIINHEKRETASEQLLIQNNFDTQEISDLISNNILSIDNDMAVGSLTLRLLYNPGLLTGNAKFQLKRYLDTILRELEEFKKEHGIATNCIIYEKDSAGNILSFRINLPSYALYAAFMLQLASKNILPTQNVNPQARSAYQSGINHFIPLNPLSTRMAPYAHRDKRREREEEEAKRAFRLPRLLPKNWPQNS
jgi:hypothetical protein